MWALARMVAVCETHGTETQIRNAARHREGTQVFEAGGLLLMVGGSEVQGTYEWKQVVPGRAARLRLADDTDGSSWVVWVIHNFGLGAGDRSEVLRGIVSDTDVARARPHRHAVVPGDLGIRWEDGEGRTRGAPETSWMRTLERLIHVAGRTPTHFEASSARLTQIGRVFVGMPRSGFVRIQLQAQAEDPQVVHAANLSDHPAVHLRIGGAVDMPPTRRPVHRDIIRSARYASVLAAFQRDLPDAWSDPVHRCRSQKVMLRAAPVICMRSSEAPMSEGARREWELGALARAIWGPDPFLVRRIAQASAAAAAHVLWAEGLLVLCSPADFEHDPADASR